MGEPVTTVISWMILVLGLSYFFQPGQWALLAKDATDSPHRFFPMILFVLVLGLTVIRTHNLWVLGWPVVITVMGWLMTIKGVVYLVFPGLTKIFASWSDHFLRVYIRSAGVLFIILGGLLVLS